MLVKNWMSKDVIFIDADDSMQNAIRLLKEHNIHTLPVVENKKLIGIVTDRDLKRASASDATALEIHELIYLISKIKVRDIMTKHPITVPLDYTIEETTEILMEKRISGVPVVNDSGEMVGIITQSDIFKVIISLSGFKKRGVQLAFRLEDRPGFIKKVLDIIREHGGRLVSILTSYHNAPEGYRHVYLRIYDLDESRLERLKIVLMENFTLLYWVDHRNNKREIMEQTGVQK